MNTTPQSNRTHVAIFGNTNSGKSSLFNAILGTDTAIVSEVYGTTTDPVSKSMELIPYGPIVLIDTAGINDNTVLGQTRTEKTKAVLDRTNFAIYAIDINDFNNNEFDNLKKEFEKRNIPYMIAFTKKDTLGKITIKSFKSRYENSIAVSVKDNNSINEFKNKLSNELKRTQEKEIQLIGDLLPKGSTIILVVPIDSESPKGRIIFPQVQLIRNCLDNGIRCNITTELDLQQALEETKKVDLVVTDSQVFKFVSQIVPTEIPLTSFSILMARNKGNIDVLINGSNAIKNLKDGSKVLIAESCTHTKNHEDIGTIKIPNGLKKVTNKNLTFEFANGRDFPNDIEKYDLIIHCGGCMMTYKEMNSRILKAQKVNVPITNYGIVLAYINGILERSIQILKK